MMKPGDLVYLRPNNYLNEEYIAILISVKEVGAGKKSGTILYDVFFDNELITVSDIFFEVRRFE